METPESLESLEKWINWTAGGRAPCADNVSSEFQVPQGAFFSDR
jgi:hypothetical protein